MENASKALIIAGAILISIILISIGIMVIQASNGLVDVAGSKMDEQTLMAFNTTYLNYLGNQRGSTVKSLLQTVIANNSNNADLAIKVTTQGLPATITAVNNSDDTSTISTLLGQLASSSTYNISVGYSDAGRVDSLTIGIAQ